jgi:hypothetical protein
VETIETIRREVERIRTAEVSDAELETARETALNGLVFAFDTRTKTLGRMLMYEYYGYPKDFIQQYQKALAAVTRADILRAAKERLAPEKFTMVAVGNPQHFAKPLDTLGPVTPIDLTIPPLKAETVKPDANSIAAAKQLLERAQKAVGGADKLAAVKDYTATARFQFDPSAGGAASNETYRWIAPTYYREDTQVQGRLISAFCDGKFGWIGNAQNSGGMSPPQLDQFLGAIGRIYFRALLADRQPGWTVNAVDDSTIEITDSGRHYQLGFDPDSGLPQRLAYDSTAVKGPPQPVEEEFSDFREVGGIRIPFHTVLLQGGKKFAETAVNEYKINSGIDIATLEKRP